MKFAGTGGSQSDGAYSEIALTLDLQISVAYCLGADYEAADSGPVDAAIPEPQRSAPRRQLKIPPNPASAAPGHSTMRRTDDLA